MAIQAIATIQKSFSWRRVIPQVSRFIVIGLQVVDFLVMALFAAAVFYLLGTILP